MLDQEKLSKNPLLQMKGKTATSDIAQALVYFHSYLIRNRWWFSLSSLFSSIPSHEKGGHSLPGKKKIRKRRSGAKVRGLP